ncbi:TPATPA infgustatory receptor 30 [Operophtera brumata]|uniref:TPATPA infgustatory receptor 30 n=1 Tax=Operophtera brumata TaxID=104452 RepID=A0A0L7L2D4_OPEBR|nr:TPATPA infgustatory receptor 30 [Operophtera brumata]
MKYLPICILRIVAGRKVSTLSPFALDLNRVWRCILFDTVRYRLKVLRKRLEETPDNFYLYIKDNKSIREDKIKFCLKLYRDIADLLEFLFMSVTCNLPKLIVNTYHILTEPYESLSFSIIHLIQISILLFSPFVVVEFYSVEVERIRLFLMHKLLDDADPQNKEDVQLFIQYTEFRPFKYRIWRIIPINISLPLVLINLCTTYVIVIINFTHLYG